MISAQSIRDKVVRVLKEHANPAKSIDERAGVFVNPFEANQSQILLETRAFSESTINVRKCTAILTKVLFLINGVGETLSAKQKTELFFGITRLFQSSDHRLRRMVYLLIKTIEPSDTEVFIVTSSLTKDMNSGNDRYRANAIRVLSRIIDSSMATQLERYLKTAIVDRDPFVASAALMCGMSLLQTVPDLVRRWVNEVQQTVSSKHHMPQFHALALLHELKRSDSLALQKIVGSLTKVNLKSNLAKCLLIRYVSEVLLVERDPSEQKPLLEYLDSCVRNKAEIVTFEAARAFCDLAIYDEEGHGGSLVFGIREIIPAITVLQVFLSSPRPVFRFAAVRVLHKLAQYRAHVVSRANADLEQLLTDSNRNISTLALTTLLKTGHESSVDRLIKQITGLMSEIPDTLKVDIVKAVKQLCLVHPAKHKVLMSFLSANLREEGSFEYKKDIVNSLIFLSREIPTAQDVALLHLCEFIEDCEYQTLCCQVLIFLGQNAPNTPNPAKYIRFIYNRLILENALVRAVAIDALAKIAVRCPALREDVTILLESCLTDSDDEVRDRARLYYDGLRRSLNTSAAVDLLGDEVVGECPQKDREHDALSAASTTDTPPSLEELVDCEQPVSIDALTEKLQKLAEASFENPHEIIDLSNIPSEEDFLKEKTEAEVSAGAAAKPKAKLELGTKSPHLTLAVSSAPTSRQLDWITELSDIITAERLGRIRHTCSSVALTEKEAEYNVDVLKHMFDSHIVLEFHVTNTMQDQMLENINVSLAIAEGSENWAVLGTKPLERLSFGDVGPVFTVLEKTPSQAGETNDTPVGSFQAMLTFLLKETGDDIGYVDEYPLEPVRVTIGSYCAPRCLPPGEFKSVWKMLENRGYEVVTKLSLSYRSLAMAINDLPNTLGLAPCDKCDVGVDPSRTNHTMTLSGSFMGQWQVVCKATIVMSPDHGCLLKLVLRANNETVCNAMLTAFD